MKRRGAVRTIAFVLLLLCHSIAPAGERKGLRILISNDDGIEAPGIAALFDALSRLGTVTVAAPSQGRSATSHGIVTDGPILVRESERKGARWYSIDALPATCVRLALESLLDTPPDIVVSGVNRGENLGVVTFYSATVACAREAAFKGIPAVAVSLESGPDMDYAAAAEAAALVIEKSPLESWPKGLYLNINAPARKRGDFKGFRVVPQDLRASIELFEGRVNPAGIRYFWPYYVPLESGAIMTDIRAVRDGYVAITPFRIDQTDRAALEGMKPLEDLSWKR
jgi:5'-nucleotidase